MLAGTKVYLRSLEEGDLARTHQWVNDPEIVEAIGVRAPISLQQQQHWFEQLGRDPSKVVFAICVTEGGMHVGNTSLRDIHRIHRHALFSIFIGDRAVRRGGIGAEATRLTLRYAFERLSLHRVYLKTTVGNAAAVALYRSVGFTEEGCLRQHEFSNGRFVDKLLFGITADEFVRAPHDA